MSTTRVTVFPDDIGGGSDIGRVRSENQDHFLIADLRRQLTVRASDLGDLYPDELFGHQEGRLLVVADGMGGMSDGELASRMAVRAAASYVLDMVHWFLKLSPGEEDHFESELSAALENIDRKIWTLGHDQRIQLGTTVTMAYVLWPQVYIVHAGDSRCYLHRSGILQQLTTDHTVAQQLIDMGQLQPNHPNLRRWHHVLWNCAGGDKRVQPEVVRCNLQVGDQLLLCSDGLTNMITDSQLADILAGEGSSQKTVDRLIAAANHAGGRDNITAVVASF